MSTNDLDLIYIEEKENSIYNDYYLTPKYHKQKLDRIEHYKAFGFLIGFIYGFFIENTFYILKSFSIGNLVLDLITGFLWGSIFGLIAGGIGKILAKFVNAITNN